MQLRDPHSFLVFWARARSVTLVGLDLRGLEGPGEPGDPMRGSLDRAEHALRRRVADHGGVELRVEDDLVFAAAFEDPGNALRFALAARARLDQLLEYGAVEPAPIAAHLATVPRPAAPNLPMVQDELRVLSRLLEAALGGAVLVPASLYRAAASALPRDAVAAELGPRRLIGVEGTRELVELRIGGGPSPMSEPPPEPPDVTNLSANPSTFVGRERELLELDRMFAGGHRLVTLLGPPGIGKTRLAVRYAALNLYRFGGGVLKVDLHGRTTPSSLLLGLSAVLGVATEGQRDLISAARQLAGALDTRGSTLLLLDGVERLAEGAAEVLGEWLLACQRTRFLVTTRERLRLDGEAVHEVGPMTSDDAVALFLRRLSESRPMAELSATEHMAVAELVERLDRLPLAIELTAARAAAVSTSSLLVQLARVQGGRAAMSERGGARANTLQQALDLTWSTLTDTEQGVLAQLSVFRGGFDLDAADAVVDLSLYEPAPWLLDVIDSLCDRSLLRSDAASRDDVVRFHIFGLIRDFAARKLATMPQRPGVERRHRLWALARAEALGAQVDLASGAGALRLLAHERENVEAAIASGRRLPREPEHVARGLLALVPLVRQRLPLEALHGLFDAYLREAAELPPSWRVNGLIQRAEVARQAGRLPAASADLEEAQRWITQVHAPALEAALQMQLGRTHRAAGLHIEAMEALKRGLAAAQVVSDRLLEAQILYAQGTIFMAWSDLPAAEAVFLQSRALYAEAAAVRRLPPLDSALARLRAEQLRFDEAVVGLREVLRVDADVLTPSQRATTLRAFGALLVDLGRPAEGERHLKDALQLARSVGASTTEAAALQYLGLLHLERGRTSEADRALTEGLAVADQTHQPMIIAVAQAHLGRLRHTQGRDAEARDLLEQAIAAVAPARFTAVLRPALGWLGVALARLGAPSEAREAARQAVDGWDPEAAQDGYGPVLCAAMVDLMLAAPGEPLANAARRARDVLAAAGRRPPSAPGAINRPPTPLGRSAETRLCARVLERRLAELLPGASLALD